MAKQCPVIDDPIQGGCFYSVRTIRLCNKLLPINLDKWKGREGTRLMAAQEFDLVLLLAAFLLLRPFLLLLLLHVFIGWPTDFLL